MSFDWNAFDLLLAEKAPQMLVGLRPPAKMEDVDAAQKAMGRTLPKELISSFLAHDGQDRDWFSFYAFFGMYRWHTIAGVVDAYLYNAEMLTQALAREDDPEVLVQKEAALLPDQVVRADLWSPAWIPLAWDPTGAALFIDLAPGPAGHVGQIVSWEPVDRARSVPIAAGLDVLLESLASALSDRRITCEHNNDFPGWTDASSGEALYRFPTRAD